MDQLCICHSVCKKTPFNHSSPTTHFMYSSQFSHSSQLPRFPNQFHFFIHSYNSLSIFKSLPSTNPHNPHSVFSFTPLPVPSTLLCLGEQIKSPESSDGGFLSSRFERGSSQIQVPNLSAEPAWKGEEARGRSVYPTLRIHPWLAPEVQWHLQVKFFWNKYTVLGLLQVIKGRYVRTQQLVKLYLDGRWCLTNQDMRRVHQKRFSWDTARIYRRSIVLASDLICHSPQNV
jgi:hypothetical protein